MVDGLAGLAGETQVPRGISRQPERFTRKSDLTRPERPGNVQWVAPKSVGRSTRVCVRSLRTQQRTDSQCQMLFVWLLCRRFARVCGWGVGWILNGSVWLVWGSGFLFVDCRLPLWWSWLYAFDGEFDPGSGRTLAACLTHASRTERPFGVLEWRTGE